MSSSDEILYWAIEMEKTVGSKITPEFRESLLRDTDKLTIFLYAVIIENLHLFDNYSQKQKKLAEIVEKVEAARDNGDAEKRKKAESILDTLHHHYNVVTMFKPLVQIYEDEKQSREDVA